MNFIRRIVGLVTGFDIRTYALIAVVLAVVGFAWSWHARGTRITELETANATLTTELEISDSRLRQAQAASARLGQRLQERERIRTSLGQITEGIARATPDQDGAVAPVLRDALSGLRSLRQRPADQGRSP